MREDVISLLAAAFPFDDQVILAFIAFLVAVVGAIQGVLVSYYGSHAREAAHKAANNAQVANAQAYVNGQELRQVKQIVNGQTSALLAHNQSLQNALLDAGITPPPAPLPEAAPPPDVTPEPPTGG